MRSASTIPLFTGSDAVQAITIPVFTGAIGYPTNWSGVWMLFNPVRFAGFRVPGLVSLVSLLPRRSIHLTPFGEDFCELCLPLDGLGHAGRAQP
ncbi:MAG TPA: hypothetical protein VLA62_03555 [Solirubrobacterales bacterium]|nr:hypothetical protein [Solirubrobacterales bacterium]